MSYDDDQTLYHLTPRGWVPGSEPPADRVETWSRSSRQASGWSKTYIDWGCVWASPDVSREDRDSLRKKHSSFMGRTGRSGDVITEIGNPL